MPSGQNYPAAPSVDDLPQSCDGHAPHSGVGAACSPSYAAAAQSPQLAGPLRRAIHSTRAWLLNQQHAQGYWVAELEGDTILESETILLLAFLGEQRGERAEKIARYLERRSSPAAAGRCIRAAPPT